MRPDPEPRVRPEPRARLGAGEGAESPACHPRAHLHVSPAGRSQEEPRIHKPMKRMIVGYYLDAAGGQEQVDLVTLHHELGGEQIQCFDHLLEGTGL